MSALIENENKIIDFMHVDLIIKNSNLTDENLKYAKRHINAESWLIYELQHDFIIGIGSDEYILKEYDNCARTVNSYSVNEYGYCHPVDIKNIMYAIKLLNSGEISNYKNQYNLKVYKLRYIGNNLFEIYKI